MELLGPFVIAAGETKVFAKSGRYLEVIAADAALDIIMLGDAGEVMDEMRGALSGFYSESQFRQFQVTNRATSAQTVTLMITDGRGGSRRQPGTVKVLDEARLRVDQRRSFMGGARQPAVASRNSSIALQLEFGVQPIYLTSMTISAGAPTFVDIAKSEPFGTLLIDTITATWLRTKDAFSTNPPRGYAQALTHTALPSFAHTYGSLLLPANTPIQIKFDEPIKIEAGGNWSQLVVIATTQNVSMAGFFEAYGD